MDRYSILNIAIVRAFSVDLPVAFAVNVGNVGLWKITSQCCTNVVRGFVREYFPNEYYNKPIFFLVGSLESLVANQKYEAIISNGFKKFAYEGLKDLRAHNISSVDSGHKMMENAIIETTSLYIAGLPLYEATLVGATTGGLIEILGQYIYPSAMEFSASWIEHF